MSLLFILAPIAKVSLLFLQMRKGNRKNQKILTLMTFQKIRMELLQNLPWSRMESEVNFQELSEKNWQGKV